MHGSGNLLQTLLRHHLVDEFQLWVFPLVLGSGKRLFADGRQHRLQHRVMIGTYEPAGEIVTGSFAVD